MWTLTVQTLLQKLLLNSSNLGRRTVERQGNFTSSTSNFNQRLQESWSSCNLGYAVAAELRLCLNDFAFTLPAHSILHWRNTRSFCRKTTPWHCFWKTTTKPNPLIPLEKAILNGKQSYAHFHTHMADSDLIYASTNWNAHYNMVKFAGDLTQIVQFPFVYKVLHTTLTDASQTYDDIYHITSKNRSWIKSYYFKRFIYLSN